MVIHQVCYRFKEAGPEDEKRRTEEFPTLVFSPSIGHINLYMKGKNWNWHANLTQPACIRITPLHTIIITPLHIPHLHRSYHPTNTALTWHRILLTSLCIPHTCMKGPERVIYFGILNILCQNVSLLTFSLSLCIHILHTQHNLHTITIPPDS